MDEFQKDIIERLMRLETKVDEVFCDRLRKVESWIEGRKVTLRQVTGICVIIFGLFEGLNILARAKGWW